MNNSIIFYDATTKLINPYDEVFNSKKLVEIFIDYDKSIDEVLTNIINYNLVNEEYTNIILPACFGKVLADFLGLRLAIHIRCTPAINQYKNIFLYSFTGLKDYFSSESFNILKTQGVFLIDYDVNTIINKTLEEDTYLHKEKLISEVKKLDLQIPLNYEDNHSIANEWAIYKWSQTIDANDQDIEKIESKLENDLYFKYLKTIYPIGTSDTLNNDDLKINFEGNPKVLYIDDEAEKGWYDIFCKIFNDENNIHFRHLDDEFNEKNKNEIIDISLNTIINDDIDLVILDFRLHKEDFENNSIENITGYQILKKIKNHNKGIQVTIFSATNKIWNLQALQKAGADGFIIKESPENSDDSEFTKKSIKNFISTTEECLSRSFLKYFFNNCDKIQQNISRPYSDLKSPFDDFKKELLVSLKIISDSANNIDLSVSSSLDVVFLNCYNFLEKFKHFYIKEIKFKLVLGFEEVEMNRYYFKNKLINEGEFIRNNTSDNPSFFHSVIAILIDYFEIINADNINIEKIYQIKESRNNYIHNDKSNFNINEISDIINVCKIITDNLKD
ncbi:CheY-like chemotaxis protein [Flavobacterium sp. 7E]|uniref:response regulator n=1 Tax=Flavobacterium sp. 7E TaxID=2735898 RepID=UPI00156DC8DB|nr:response regulator [Flavobacterium sp. 7E]NRS87788.1 CheY-like chemotaxis protein [Flavobacterium sp. 7E]